MKKSFIILIHCAFLIIFAFTIWTGVRGVDYGNHWDESRLLRSVSQSMDSGLLLPRWYNYPSVPYAISFLTMSPEYIQNLPPMQSGALFIPGSGAGGGRGNFPTSPGRMRGPTGERKQGDRPGRLPEERSQQNDSSTTPDSIPFGEFSPTDQVSNNATISDGTNEQSTESVLDATSAIDSQRSETDIDAQRMERTPPDGRRGFGGRGGEFMGRMGPGSGGPRWMMGSGSSVNVMDYFLRIRIVFSIVTLLSMVWIYIAIGYWKNDWLAGLLGASILGFSWELAYHARWIAPDAILMQFASMTLMFVVLSQRTTRWFEPRFWLVMASIAAGLACGTKYQGGALLLPVFLASLFIDNQVKFSFKAIPWSFMVKLFFIFIATFLISTPGAFVEPYNFIGNVVGELQHYQQGHMGHSIEPGLAHLQAMGDYLARVLLSPFQYVAIFFIVFVGIGIIALAWKEWRMALIVILFPVLYISYMSLQKAMLVRNLLIVLPFIAVLSAIGIRFIQKQFLDRGTLRFVLPTIVFVALLSNAAWIFYASQSIRSQEVVDEIEYLNHYIDKHPEQQFLLTSNIHEQLISFEEKDRPNITSEYVDGVKVICSSHDASEMPAFWPSNQYGRYQLLDCGPYDVNFNYYPDWSGSDRIVIMPYEIANQIGVREAMEPVE
jgi:hypothetical protein